MSARRWTWVMLALLGGLLVLAGYRGVLLLATGDPGPMALGLVVLAFPVVGAWLTWRELRFGQATERLADRLAAEGGLPVDDLPRRPSGRAEPDAALARFDIAAAEAAASPQDWRAWYRVGLAYDDAGDRRRARGAMREAVRLAQADAEADGA
jgi:Zn-dependent protease with chaperone function